MTNNNGSASEEIHAFFLFYALGRKVFFLVFFVFEKRFLSMAMALAA
jgi:hypothetical protein